MRTIPKPRFAAPGSMPITTCMDPDSGPRVGCLQVVLGLGTGGGAWEGAGTPLLLTCFGVDACSSPLAELPKKYKTFRGVPDPSQAGTPVRRRSFERARKQPSSVAAPKLV